MAHKILVVEDSGDMREMMQLYLASEGFTVIVARDGNEGIDIATKENPELIVTDTKMPGLDGVEMIKRLHAQARFANMPIIIVTGTDSASQREAKMAGADRVLLKPVSPTVLVTEIERLLSAKISREGSTQD